MGTEVPYPNGLTARVQAVESTVIDLRVGHGRQDVRIENVQNDVDGLGRAHRDAVADLEAKIERLADRFDTFTKALFGATLTLATAAVALFLNLAGAG